MDKLPPTSDRFYNSEQQRRRYRTDPAFRLNRINRTRARNGKPPRASLEECNLRLEVR